MKGCWGWLLALTLVPALSLAQVNALPSLPHLLVKGHAESRFVPDRFTITLDVGVVDKDAGKAQAKVEQHMQEIFGALDQFGALSERTQASSLNIRPKTRYHDDEEVFDGMEVTREVKAIFDDADKLRGFVGSLHTGEELQIDGIEVARSDVDELNQQLREQAMANSRETAKRIAASYGMTIKSVYSVSQVAPNFAYGVGAGQWQSPDGGSQSLSAIQVTASALRPELRIGTIELRQNIYAVYLTRP